MLIRLPNNLITAETEKLKTQPEKVNVKKIWLLSKTLT